MFLLFHGLIFQCVDSALWCTKEFNPILLQFIYLFCCLYFEVMLKAWKIITFFSLYFCKNLQCWNDYLFILLNSLVLVHLTIYSRFYFCVMKFRLKLKKIGKTTRPFRYELNQISYDYTVEVTNRFRGLDLIECLKNYGQRFVTQWLRPSPRKRNWKGKMVVRGDLTDCWEKKRS